jgi:hypothetical protein
MDLDAKGMRRLVPSAFREMPAYEHMSKSTISAEWKSFVTSTDVGPWEDSVDGLLAHLDEDRENYRLEALHAHVVPLYENELAAKE